MKRSILLALMMGMAAWVNVSVRAEDGKADLKPYPLDTCVVSGEKMEIGDGVAFEHEGREIKTCCKDCRKEFESSPEKYVGKVDEAAKKVKKYPLKTCIVSGEELGSMGKPIVLVREGQEVKLFCKGCVKEFKKNSKDILAKVKKAQPAK
jgi:hypothetical protein